MWSRLGSRERLECPLLPLAHGGSRIHFHEKGGSLPFLFAVAKFKFNCKMLRPWTSSGQVCRTSLFFKGLVVPASSGASESRALVAPGRSEPPASPEQAGSAWLSLEGRLRGVPFLGARVADPALENEQRGPSRGRPSLLVAVGPGSVSPLDSGASDPPARHRAVTQVPVPWAGGTPPCWGAPCVSRVGQVGGGAAGKVGEQAGSPSAPSGGPAPLGCPEHAPSQGGGWWASEPAGPSASVCHPPHRQARLCRARWLQDLGECRACGPARA